MSEGIKSIWRDPPAQNDEGIDLSDIPELGEEFFRQAQLRGPLIEKYTALVDRDVYEWFQLQGPDYLQRMNQVLLDYVKTQCTIKAAESA